MKHRQWLFLFATFLIALSALLFGVHYLLFGDLHHIGIYTLHDIAFLPIEVLLVTIVIHSLLERQNLQQKLEKLNMVIGAFYSGIGTELLRTFAAADCTLAFMEPDLLVDSTWDKAAFKVHKKRAREFEYLVESGMVDLVALREVLVRHEDFLLRILENPVMLEHESFSNVLRAVFHLTEELKSRENLQETPPSDRSHLGGDITRAYSLMTLSWLDYMQYLQSDYPYLFSLAIRINPFSLTHDACVRE